MSQINDYGALLGEALKGLWANRRFRLWTVTAGPVFILLITLSTWLFFWPSSFSAPDTRIINISRGETFNAIVDSLYSKGIISGKASFKIAGRILGLTKDLEVGRYTFSSPISNLTILKSLSDGSARSLIPVSIPEGVQMTTIAGRFSKHLGIDSAAFMAYCTDSAFAARWNIPDTTVEGYLFPNTYFFHWQTDERMLVEELLSSFWNFYSDSLRQREKELGLTMHEVITFASIVEKETQLPDERPVVAGVYHNRLQKRMRLEADPTIQYILPDGPRRLLYRDLRIPSPYNTYRNHGLPPGPIGNPGREAILATLYPTDHQYLYFVADGKGGHTFSRSYSEHQRAVRVYRRIRREMQRNANLGG